jgi:arylsulfatase
LIDLAPTILELLGVPRGKSMEGTSLLPLLHGAAPDRAAFAQTYYGDGAVALREGATKYIYTPPVNANRPQGKSDPPAPAAGREELYDLSTDPGELHDLASSRPESLKAYKLRVEQWLKEQSKRAGALPAERPATAKGPSGRVLGDPQLERQLRALGYIE